MNTHAPLFAAALAAALTATSPAAHAQKKPAAKKPPVKKPAAGPVVLGTTQLPGEFGKVGTTYTVGKQSPINFTLESVRYSPARFCAGPNTWAPNQEQKLMVLRFTLHNPLPREQYIGGGNGVKFTAVDATDVNHDTVGPILRAGVYNERNYYGNLKPAQKILLETAILVPANGETPKLIVEREKGAPVIRYDLRGKAGKLPAPFADPADATGATLLAEVPAEVGKPYPAGAFDVTVESVGFSGETLARLEPKPGEKFATVTVKLKNATQWKQRYYWPDWEATLRDADGEKVTAEQTLVKATRPDQANETLEPGEDVRVRFLFRVPKDSGAPQSLRLKEKLLSGDKGRSLFFDLSGLTPQEVAAASGG